MSFSPPAPAPRVSATRRPHLTPRGGRVFVRLSLVGTVWGSCKSSAPHALSKPRPDLVNEKVLKRPKRGFRGRSAVDPQTTKYPVEDQTGVMTRSNGVDIVQVHTWNVGGGRDPDQEWPHTRLVPHRRVMGEGRTGCEGGAQAPLYRFADLVRGLPPLRGTHVTCFECWSWVVGSCGHPGVYISR